ncbi:MAG: hypothetical protein ACOCUK_01890, partial [bacterium]
QAYIEVREDGPSDVSCTGEWNWLSVQVYAEPDFTFINENDGGIQDTDGSNQTPGGSTIELCDDGEGITKDILIASIADNGIPIGTDEEFDGSNFKFRLDKDVAILDGDDNVVSTKGTSTDSIAEVTAEFDNGIVLHSEHDLSTLTDDEGENRITRYRFDFGNEIDENGNNNNGITDPVQRKSQYLSNPDANNQDYDYVDNSGDDDMLTIITYPAPETGNIHYVPNDFDQ